MIDKNTILHMAHLSKLEITENDAKEYAVQLSRALSYFEQISEINTVNVEPLITPIDLEPHERIDEVKIDQTAEELISCAPARSGNLFKVPPVV